jgi:hypothetical protein
VWGALSLAHFSMQVAPVAHDSEQLPLQRSVQLESAPQLMLPLSPTVMSHVE